MTGWTLAVVAALVLVGCGSDTPTKPPAPHYGETQGWMGALPNRRDYVTPCYFADSIPELKRDTIGP